MFVTFFFYCGARVHASYPCCQYIMTTVQALRIEAKLQLVMFLVVLLQLNLREYATPRDLSFFGESIHMVFAFSTLKVAAHPPMTSRTQFLDADGGPLLDCHNLSSAKFPLNTHRTMYGQLKWSAIEGAYQRFVDLYSNFPATQSTNRT